MDWFESLTGFRETGYEDTRAKLKAEGSRLHSLVNGKSYGIGELELVSLRTLRERVRSSRALPGRLKVSVVRGDVRQMHQAPENAGALFQVASQFNLLEMVSPTVPPEDGVTRYQRDGPPRRILRGSLALLTRASGRRRGARSPPARPRSTATISRRSAEAHVARIAPSCAIRRVPGFRKSSSGLRTRARAYGVGAGLKPAPTCIGHRDVEVTEAAGERRPMVLQAFCSALPVAYTSIAPSRWKAFASLVLEGAYEATLCAAVHNAQRGASSIVLLTSLGGGAFGNDESWIVAAMRRALEMMRGTGLEAKLVSYGAPSRALLEVAEELG